MYIYQNGKLYTQLGETLVGVEIYPHEVVQVKGTETKLADEYESLTKYEVLVKFNIANEPYIFPQEKKVEKEVKSVEPVVKVKKPTGKSVRK